MLFAKRFQEAFGYHRKFSSIQKIILLTVLLAIFAGFSSKFLLSFLLYVSVITTTVGVCQYLISSKHHFTYLLRVYIFYKNQQHVIDNILELQSKILEYFGLNEKESENIIERNIKNEELFYDATDKQSSSEPRSEYSNQQIALSCQSNSWKEEVYTITELIQKHFIHIWLKDFDPHLDLIKEIDKVLKDGFKSLAKSIKTIDTNTLVKEICLNGRQHLKTLQTSRDKYKTQPKRRSSSSRRDSLTHLSPKKKIASVEEAFELVSTYHIGLYGEEDEQHYLLSVCEILLSRTLGDVLQDCQVPNSLLSEILTYSVFLPVIDFLSEPDFIYEKMILILSDEALEFPLEEEYFPSEVSEDSDNTEKEIENYCDISCEDIHDPKSVQETLLNSQLSANKGYLDGIFDEKEAIPDVPLTMIHLAHLTDSSESNSNSCQVEQPNKSIKQEKAMLKDIKPDFFLSCAEDEQDSTVEFSKQQEGYLNSMEVIACKPLIFQDLSMIDYEVRKESRSSSQFVLYNIQYHALYWVEADKDPVLRTREAKRRHREFINLHARLEDNSAYKICLKGVVGPKRWKTFPFGNLNKKSIEERQKSLETYLKSLIQIEEICNGPELNEFLAYEGDGHIAFVRKSPEINVPRIDKMIVKTMSGVFDEIVKLPSRVSFPSLPGKKDSSREVEKEDSDQITVEFDIDSKYGSEEESIENFVVICDSNCCLTEGFPGRHTQNKTEGLSGEDISLAEAVVDIGVQTLQGKDHWVCRERVIIVAKHLIGTILDRWLQDQINDLTSEERCVKYLQLLRETVWPDGELFEGGRPVKTDRQKSATKEQARRCLAQFFPDTLRKLIGTEDFDHGINEIIESLQYKKLNRHLIYTLLDLLLENMYPEIQTRNSSQ